MARHEEARREASRRIVVEFDVRPPSPSELHKLLRLECPDCPADVHAVEKPDGWEYHLAHEPTCPRLRQEEAEREASG